MYDILATNLMMTGLLFSTFPLTSGRKHSMLDSRF